MSSGRVFRLGGGKATVIAETDRFCNSCSASQQPLSYSRERLDPVELSSWEALVSRSRWRLFSAAIATVALAVTAMVAGPATAAVPGPPSSVTARAGDHLAEVTWTAPTPDDPTITGYVVTASPADTPPVTVDPTARTATVTGLTNGTAYTFTVAARAACGTRA
jgi:hypothetical protein